ncbi:hypothetical protein SLEP1_g56206 [Rubroshorea leprosula]|uniref:PGG domain-containing protein n=1 Tax=Rubroshorea leprosula TaxID=152421 RepID=A0AAV5MHT3_9ROSI|nr:hypothetical protein SLEP1_g56206 [Rubroshorea leprosula]
MHQQGQSKSEPEIGVEGSDGKEDEITEMIHWEEDVITEDFRIVELGKSIRKGDWNAVKQFFVFDKHPLDTIIEGYTALHFAILAGKYEIAEELIMMMSETDLERKTAWNVGGHTALTLVATTGITHLARCLVGRNRSLLRIGNDQGHIPVTAACAVGHKEMTYYLYSVTPPEVFLPQNGRHGSDLMWAGIDNKIFVKEIYDLKLTHLRVREILRFMCDYISTLKVKSLLNCGVVDAMFEATKQGIVEFVVELLKVSQPFIFRDNDGRHVFMIAIEYRQENIFSLLYGIHGGWKAYILNQTDGDGNNMLHLAGELAPSSQLDRFSSPALQMQTELQWFKEVERIVPEWCKESKNKNGQTPYELLSRSHAELVRACERWIGDAASSFTLVSTLIMTITFAAVITLPGGNAQDGFPNFLQKRSFMTFIVSDAISFITALTSVLVFWRFLLSPVSHGDGSVFSSKKLIILLSISLISAAAMTVSFSAALLIILQHRRWAIIPIIVMACIPVLFFVWLQFPFLVEMYLLTFARGVSFDRKMKPWL